MWIARTDVFAEEDVVLLAVEVNARSVKNAR
jgi:hypothetical protein